MKIAVPYPSSKSDNVVLIIDLVHAVQAEKGTRNICEHAFNLEAYCSGSRIY